MGDPATTSITGTSAIIASVIPVVLGGVTTYFRIFITPKEDFRNRTKLKRCGLRERVAARLTALLQHVRALEQDDLLRGDGRESVDFVGEYTEETFRTFTIYHRLSVLDSIVRYSYYVLYGTIVLGLAGCICGLFVPVTRYWVVGVAIGAIIVQVMTILLVLMASCKLEDYEDVT